MRLTLAALFLLIAARAHALNIVTPGPPPNPADYIVIGLGWEYPPYAFARARGSGNDFIPILPNQDIWVPHNAGGIPAERGLLDIRYGMTPNAPWTFTIPLESELNRHVQDSRYFDYSAHLGYDNYVNGLRAISITGVNWTRPRMVKQVPEPTAWALASVGGLALLRRRKK